MKKYKILRDDRAASGCPDVGTIVYPGADYYGVAADDSRSEGLEHIALSVNESGEPWFTIPKHDVQEVK